MFIKQGVIYKCLWKKYPDKLYSYWIAPVDPRDSYHMEDMLVNITTGEIMHYSHFNIISSGPYEVYFD
jgi:hypothetical protein